MQITDNTILITGGTSGIGLGLAQEFLRAGNRVIVAGRRPEALAEALAANPGLVGLRLDVTDPASIATAVAEVTRNHPGLNVLINNAGIMQAEALGGDQSHVATAEATITTNLLGPIRLTAALLPHLRAQGRATVINVTSGLAFVPLALTPTYCATKAGLHSWTQSLRHQLRGTPVEVLELAPPMVQTELMPGQSADPRGMPLQDFLTETMALLAAQPTPEEICVERVGVLRQAEATGKHATVFAMINGGHQVG
jgi:uncharacterized oxidoreductase